MPLPNIGPLGRNRRRLGLHPPRKAPRQAQFRHEESGGRHAAWKFCRPPVGFAYFAREQSRSSVRRRTKRSLATDFSAVVCRRDGGIQKQRMTFLSIKLLALPVGEYIFHHSPPGERSPSFCGRRLEKSLSLARCVTELYACCMMGFLCKLHSVAV